MRSTALSTIWAHSCQAPARCSQRMLAFGKLNIARSAGSSDRLVLYSTAPGVNQCTHNREQFELPTLAALKGCVSESPYTFEATRLSMDVSAAHTCVTCATRCTRAASVPTPQHLYYFTRPAMFGASCSAYWWSSVAGLFHRVGQHFSLVPHLCLFYVDGGLWDFLPSIAPIMASTILICLFAFGLPLSWEQHGIRTRL